MLIGLITIKRLVMGKRKETIPGFTNYSITECGEISNKKRNRLLVAKIGNAGYFRLGLVSDEGIRVFMSVHRLVARVFLNNFSEALQVNHKDGNKLNNHCSNLEMVTCKENIDHASRLGLRKTCVGKNNGMSKLLDLEVIEIFELRDLMYQKDIAKLYNISRANVGRIHNKQLWGHILNEKN